MSRLLHRFATVLDTSPPSRRSSGRAWAEEVCSAMDELAEAGDALGLGQDVWEAALLLARAHGWEPRGTWDSSEPEHRLPDYVDGGDLWVDGEDARALGKALDASLTSERALALPRPPKREPDVLLDEQLARCLLWALGVQTTRRGDLLASASAAPSKSRDGRLVMLKPTPEARRAAQTEALIEAAIRGLGVMPREALWSPTGLFRPFALALSEGEVEFIDAPEIEDTDDEVAANAWATLAARVAALPSVEAMLVALPVCTDEHGRVVESATPGARPWVALAAAGPDGTGRLWGLVVESDDAGAPTLGTSLDFGVTDVGARIPELALALQAAAAGRAAGEVPPRAAQAHMLQDARAAEFLEHIIRPLDKFIGEAECWPAPTIVALTPVGSVFAGPPRESMASDSFWREDLVDFAREFEATAIAIHHTTPARRGRANLSVHILHHKDGHLLAETELRRRRRGLTRTRPWQQREGPLEFHARAAPVLKQLRRTRQRQDAFRGLARCS